LNKDGVDKASSSNDDIGHLLTPAHQAAGFSLFDLFRIVDATDNFSLENKIGEGGFGRVYKGQLNGLPVAVKRCFVESSPERLSDFENEIKFIPRLQHRNIVTLKGYCIEGKERILVYEYMQNKSLDKFIFGPRTDWSLYWDRLFAIIEGIAQGIVYLHLHSGLKIIHRDLKLSNILLDSEMNPKISDFGTARSGFPNKGRRTDTVSGTYGYMAPEYSTRGIFSGKSDVFSFGSLLLEIVSGKRNGTWYSIRERKSISLHEYVSRLSLLSHMRIFSSDILLLFVLPLT
jgi:serine/threonine protein kinase